jgi:hypothetical protein
MDSVDNCRDVVNPDQLDSDHDDVGNACETDDDNDGVLDKADNCPTIANPDQKDKDVDGIGDACDLCPDLHSTNNTDTDNDGLANPCDPDDDNDSVPDAPDNCPLVPNTDQLDLNHNGVGGACEDEAEWLMNHAYPLAARFFPGEPIHIPMPGQCTSCGGGYLQPGFIEQLNVNMGISFYAQVTNSDGMPVATTTRRGSLQSQNLRYQPAPYTFSAAGGGLQSASEAGEALAPDQIHYWLEILPLSTVDYGQTYTVTVEFQEQSKWMLYLPVAFKNH